MSENYKLEVAKNKLEEWNYTSKESVFFQITSSDVNLRELMYFIQTEGIITQNSFSDSVTYNSSKRNFYLWVDKSDQEKIKNWLDSKK